MFLFVCAKQINILTFPEVIIDILVFFIFYSFVFIYFFFFYFKIAYTYMPVELQNIQQNINII